ncbi:MAG: winged helix-turn-helix domain-containing protein [Candidatus Bathyarchaeota archaeon]|nr:winged helix-turn-helix domain-containing protein [Candidatus Bathyarchaeota archaeon]
MLALKHKRRDQLNIIASILHIAKGGVLKTQIMYQANLSFSQRNDYIVFLLNNGLITPAEINGKEGLIITVKGTGFLNRYHELMRLIEPNSTIRQTGQSKRYGKVSSVRSPAATPQGS